MLTWSLPAWILLSFLQARTAAPPPARPACTAQTRGMFWPPAALNTERGKRCEELTMCTGAMFGHKWRPVRLPYWKLAGREAPLSCRPENSLAGAIESLETRPRPGGSHPTGADRHPHKVPPGQH